MRPQVRRVTVGHHVVHQLLRHGLDAGLPRGHALGGEPPAHGPPPPRVLPAVRRDGHRHVAAEDPARLLVGEARGAVRAQHIAEPGVGQQPADVLGPGEQRRLVPAGQAYAREGAPLPQRGPLSGCLQCRIAVEGIPREQIVRTRVHTPS
ncbi:hypothetical protein ABZZ74_42040 [Streptomyces sp. NPDC006476]|uniref:hypothetical protein n=1 Tax=Streptomyces sp. NPDC006476 TaxID=3157175 RepID=UPI0033B3B119